MVDVARKNLLEEKSRFVMSVSGVAFSVFLILLVAAILNAFVLTAIAYSDRTRADIWVAQKGATATGLASTLPAGLRSKVLGVDGVLEAHPILITTSAIRVGNAEAPVILVGYDLSGGVGGPWKIAEGTPKLESGQVVVDRTLARLYGFPVGGSIEIFNRKLTVVGFSDETNLWYAQYVFLGLEDLMDLLRIQEVASYLLVSVSDNSRVLSIAEEISKTFDVSVYTKEEVVRAYREQNERSFIPMLFIMYIVSFVVGTAVIGLTVFAMTFEKIKEFAVLRAIGASSRRLYAIVFEQSVIIAFSGFAFGALATYVISIVLPSMAPQVVAILLPESVVQGLLLTVGMSLFSSYIPIRRLARVEPAMAFRA